MRRDIELSSLKLQPSVLKRTSLGIAGGVHKRTRFSADYTTNFFGIWRRNPQRNLRNLKFVFKDNRETLSFPNTNLEILSIWQLKIKTRAVSATWQILEQTRPAWENHDWFEIMCVNLTKPCDTVKQNVLCNKMYYYSISGIPHKLIISYLSERQ